MKSKVSILITDIDNTLYDWFTMWYCSFNGMLQHLVQKSGIDQKTLERETRPVFKYYGTTEYLLFFKEIPSLKAKHPDEDLANVYNSAIQIYLKAQNASLHLYPGVMDTLIKIKEAGVCIIAYTESLGFYTARRLKKFQLDGIIDYLYSPRDHDLPKNMSANDVRLYSSEEYDLRKTVHLYTGKDDIKPEARVLQSIVDNTGEANERIIYVGDSLTKDIVMAQKVGVKDVHAEYGVVSNTEAYQLLQRVSHWGEEDIEREMKTTVTPTYILKKSFNELLDIFDFVPYHKQYMMEVEHER
jgi:FMN phosphatase YigB (HAD superfamily)